MYRATVQGNTADLPASVGLRPGGDRFRVGHDDRDEVAAQAVPVHVRLGHERALRVDVLELLWSDVLALRYRLVMIIIVIIKIMSTRTREQGDDNRQAVRVSVGAYVVYDKPGTASAAGSR